MAVTIRTSDGLEYRLSAGSYTEIRDKYEALVRGRHPSWEITLDSGVKVTLAVLQVASVYEA